MFIISLSLGQPVIGAFQANDRSASLNVDRVDLVDSDGAVLEAIEEVLVLGGNAFAVRFTPPSVVFYWKITGKDDNGLTFSRISDMAIEVSTIDLTLGMNKYKRAFFTHYCFLLLQEKERRDCTHFDQETT